MNESEHNDYWSQLFLVAVSAFGIFASIEYVPTVLPGVAGIIVSLVVASVCLYNFGKLTGRMIATSQS